MSNKEISTESLNQKDKERIKILYKHLENGDQSMNQWPKQAILILGNTGAGKTTSAYILNNFDVYGQLNKGRIIYKVDEQYKDAIIGHTNKSQTQIPNFFPLQKGKMLIDCPGFLDTFKFERVISNAYYIYKLFSKIQSMKFIIAISEQGFSGKGKEFIQTVQGFLSLFNFDKNFSVEKIVNSTYLLVTKSNTINKQCISDIISMFTQQRDNCIFKTFLQQIKSQNRIVFIQVAKKGQKCPKNDILKLIEETSGYFKRHQNINQKVYDMQQIHFQINESNLKEEQKLLTRLALKYCNDFIEYMTGLIADSIQQIQQIFANDKQINMDYKFINQWIPKIQNKYQISIIKQWSNFKISECQVKHFNVLKLLEQCIKSLEYLQNLNQKSNMNNQSIQIQLQNYVLQLLQKFIYYLPLGQLQIKNLKIFTYLINRKFQEIKILSKIQLNSEDMNNRHITDRLKSYSSYQYYQIQQKYFFKYQIQKINDHKYYEELTNYLNKNINRIKLQKPNDAKKFILKNLIAYTLDGQYYLREGNKVKAGQLYIKAIKQSITLYKQQNKQSFCRLYKEPYQKLALLLQKLQLHKEAYKIYLILNYIPNIIKCSNRILNKLTLDQQKYQNRKTLAEFLITNARIYDAISYYQEAIYFGKPNQQQIISNLINNILDDENVIIKEYKNRLNKKQYYNSVNLNFSEILNNIKKKSQQIQNLAQDEDLYV